MNIFVDLHHVGLYDSFHLLFEKRLKHQLFRPIGLEWFYNGYWKVAEVYGNHPATISQFLEVRGVKEKPFVHPLGTIPLNPVKAEKPEYYDIDVAPYGHKALTVEQFKAMQIDIVIASYPPHYATFKQLITDLKPEAKLILHAGNNWDIFLYGGKNIMASIAPRPVPDGINAVFYHQEFDTDIFCYQPPVYSKKIKSFIHCFDSHPDNVIFLSLEQNMKDWDFKIHGMVNRDGIIQGSQQMADAMHESQFIWHVKRGGDGYGHVIHNCFACGRPPIVRRAYYAGQLAEKLFEDGKTCIEIDGLNTEQLINKIEEYSQPDKYEQMCQDAYHKFLEVVDFNKEAEDIKLFLSNIL